MHIKALWSKEKKKEGPYRVIDTNLFAFISSTRCFPPPLRASLWSSCVVLPLLALTWMSAVLAMTDKRSILFQILFAVFDSLQGFVIVMVHCVLRREVEDDLTFAFVDLDIQTVCVFCRECTCSVAVLYYCNLSADKTTWTCKLF